MPRCPSALLACCLLAALVATHAYPTKWEPCSPPSFAQGDHFAVDGSDKPLTDSTIKVSLSVKGRATATYCPGATYSLKISWASARHAHITTNRGTLGTNDGCGGRRFRFPEALKTTSWTSTLRFPCATKGPTVIKVVTAKSSTSPFQQVSATIRQGSAAACRAVARCPTGK